MENQAIIESFLAFKEEKNIDRITLMAFIEEAFRNQLRKKYEDDENFDVIVNPDKGDLEIWRNRTVVEDGAVEDENMEIELSAALKIEPDYEVGEEVSEEVKLIDLGRRFILAFRQNLVSRIQEHDSSELFKRYKDLEGEPHHTKPLALYHNAQTHTTNTNTTTHTACAHNNVCVLRPHDTTMHTHRHTHCMP